MFRAGEYEASDGKPRGSTKADWPYSAAFAVTAGWFAARNFS